MRHCSLEEAKREDPEIFRLLKIEAMGTPEVDDEEGFGEYE